MEACGRVLSGRHPRQRGVADGTPPWGRRSAALCELLAPLFADLARGS